MKGSHRHLWFWAVTILAAVAVAAVQVPETVTLDKAKNTCHHTQKGLTAEATEVKPCASCHLDPEKPETPSMREMSLSKNPFHKRCIDCHKTEAKGPTKCAECHKK